MNNKDYKIEINVEPWEGDLREENNCFDYNQARTIQRILVSNRISLSRILGKTFKSNDYLKIKEQYKSAYELLAQMDNYLNINNLTNIASNSIFHNNMKEKIKQARQVFKNDL